MVQLPAAATLVPQLLDSLKLPEAEILVTLRLAVPGFDSVMLCAALVVFVFWLAKVRLAGETPALGVPDVVVVAVELPPPQAASKMKRPKAEDVRAKFKGLCFPRVTRRNSPKKNAPVKAITAGAASGLGRTRWLPGAVIPDAVVFTVTVTGRLVVPDVKVREAGAVKPVVPLKLHVAPAGRPEHAKVTVPVNPATEYAVTFSVPEEPGLDTVTAGLDEPK